MSGLLNIRVLLNILSDFWNFFFFLDLLKSVLIVNFFEMCVTNKKHKKREAVVTTNACSMFSYKVRAYFSFQWNPPLVFDLICLWMKQLLQLQSFSEWRCGFYYKKELVVTVIADGNTTNNLITKPTHFNRDSNLHLLAANKILIIETEIKLLLQHFIK